MKLLVGLVSVVLFANIALAQSVSVDVVLNPMGDFKASTNDVKGSVTAKDGTFTASNITVNLKKLKTGIELRDKHTQKYLETDKFPEAVLVSAEGKDGKGTGKIKIRGIEKDISGTYKVAAKKLQAEFKLKLSDFKIEEVNYMGVGVEDEVTVRVIVPVAP